MWIFFKYSRPFFFSRFPPTSVKPTARGFTLVELLVVSSIVLIITTFTLFQQAKFNSTTLLRSLAYNVALSIRQAQVYGTSVRGFTSGGGVSFGTGYGIHFPSAVTPYQYYLFSDISNTDGIRTSSAEDATPPSPFKVGSGYALKQLCVRVGAGALDCSISTLTVFFRRPNPEPCISTNANTVVCGLGVTPVYSSAYVTLGSTANADTRSIKVTDTGQISICKPNLSDLTLC